MSHKQQCIVSLSGYSKMNTVISMKKYNQPRQAISSHTPVKVVIKLQKKEKKKRSGRSVYEYLNITNE